jgi:cytochrome c556
MRIRVTTAIAMAAVAIGVTTAIAQNNAATARMELMESNGDAAYDVLNRMARGQIPYDQAKVDAAYAKLIENAPKIATAFPPGSCGSPMPKSKYYAATKACESQADIKARAEKLSKALADTRGKIKDLASLKAIWPTVVRENCNSCHEPYRVKKG